MIRLLPPTAGPTIVLGDCLAAVMVLHDGDDGELYGDCPTCGQRTTDTTNKDGGVVEAQHFDGGTFYLQGGGRLVPCGHEIGTIQVANWPGGRRSGS